MMERPTFSHDSSARMETLIGSVQGVRELESFALRHCRREAERLRGTAPADAMLAIVAHAEGALRGLVAACSRDGLTVWQSRGASEPWLSLLRERAADLWRHREHSYRATLHQLGQGIHRMRIVAASANASSKTTLAEFCSSWLMTRSVLLQRAEVELAWFARNPEKGSDQRWLGERYGRLERGPALHPLTRETGSKGASNVGQDETSGSE